MNCKHNNNSFLTPIELSRMNFKSLGENVLISRNACFYNSFEIEIGNNVRIDDFCILSGNITIGDYVHISAYCGLYGTYKITIEDFSGISPRCTLFTATDDFSGNWLIGPMVDERKRNVINGEIYMCRYVQVGSSSVIMPKVTLNTGVVVGAMSFVRNDLLEWSIYAGIPAVKIKNRERNLLKLLTDI